MIKQRIAIIGGGVSGLATAYNLLKSEAGFDYEIHIYEANSYLGGNADTEEVDLGEIKDVLLAGASQEDEPHLIRKADLGVDDFNRDTYTNIVRIMKEIGFTNYRPLEDTASFFTLDGSKVLTSDKELFHGTSDPNTAIGEALASTYSTFMSDAAKAITNPDTAEKYKHYTVGRYVAEYIADNHGDSPLLEEMRDCLLYPRINAMYFLDDVTGPAGMPLRAVMRYYIIQEGFKQDDPNPPSPDRNYFIKGAQEWIDELASYLTKKFPNQLEIIRNSQANVFVEKNKVLVTVPPKADMEGLPKPQAYDKVVVTCHADDAMRAIKQGLNQDLINVLDKVRYTNSIAVAHTFAGVLPPDRNAWRSYNVLINEGQSIHPYSMTYVMNRHRNDAAVWYEEDKQGVPVMKTTKYNKAGMPQYFVTLNPIVSIPDKYVLKTPKGKVRKPAGYFKHFSQHEQVLPGWRALAGDLEAEQPVIGWFKHNVLNFDCLDAQEQIKKLQGGDHHNLYFTGGWTHGAGLHEECWEIAEEVVNKMIQHEQSKQNQDSSCQQAEAVH